MNIKEWILVSFLIIISTQVAICEKADTVFYDNGKVRSIEFKKKGYMILKEFNSETGENLMVSDSFNYSYYDKQIDMQRMVQVKHNKIIKEFWFNDKDTLYYRAKFDPSYIQLRSRFLDYVNLHLKFPEEYQNENLKNKVVISFIVNKKGKIIYIKPLTNSGYRFESDVINLLKTYSYYGILNLNGTPVNVYIKFPVRFINDTDDWGDLYN